MVLMQVLLVVDLQKDFMQGGSLAVPGAELVVPVINALIPKFEYVIASKDWHPEGHISFASTHHKKAGEKVDGQILWPDHCIQGTPGSDFCDTFDQMSIKKIFYKGTQQDGDSYSAFFDNKKKSTGLKEFLDFYGITKIILTGLVLEYCVAATALDGIKLGYEVVIVKDGVASLISEEKEEKFFESLKKENIEVVSFKQMFS